MGATAAVVTAVVAVYSANESRKTAKEQKKAARRNEDFIRKEAEEEARRLEKAQKMQLAEAEARVGATGLKMSGSQLDYVEEMKKEQNAQLDWLKKSGATRAEIAGIRGNIEASASRTRSLEQLASGASQSAYYWSN